MRILHPSSVNYIKPSNNQITSNQHHHNNSNTIVDGNNDSIRNSTTNFSSDLTNLNGNANLIDDNNRISYENNLIDSDDNVNLTISTTNCNNISVKYTRNQNYRQQQQHHVIVDKTITTQDSTICNNLNQLNNFKNNEHEIRRNLNGNDNDGRQIFEGNLNVLEPENENESETGSTTTVLATSDLGNVKNRVIERNLIVSGQSLTSEDEDDIDFEEDQDEDEEDDDDDEEDCEEEDDENEEDSYNIEEEDEDDEDVILESSSSSGSRNLIYNDYHMNDIRITSTNIRDRTSLLSLQSESITTSSGDRNNSVPEDIISVSLEREVSFTFESSGKNLTKLDFDRNLSPDLNHQNIRQNSNNQNQSDLEHKIIEGNKNNIEENFISSSIITATTTTTTTPALSKNTSKIATTPQSVSSLPNTCQISDQRQGCDDVDGGSVGGTVRNRRIVSYSSTYSSGSSPDDSLMEDEDPYSLTPSTCTSLNSPEPTTNFPRGIINPNYPGFQHLAHTLSEHFVNHHHHSSDPDDSDLSEFEIELSVESLDENFTQFHLNNNNLNNNINNNINNNNNEQITSDVLNNLTINNDEKNFNLADTKSHEICENKEIILPEIDVNFLLENNELESNCVEIKESPVQETKEEHQAVNTVDPQQENIENHESTIEIPSSEQSISNQQPIEFYEREDISCDLDTYLKKFETATDIKHVNQQNPKIMIAPSEEFVSDREMDATDIRNCPTPDILIKNDKTSCRKKTTENRPDLLRNVSPNPELRSTNYVDLQSCKNVVIDRNNCIDNNIDDIKKSRIPPVPDTIPIETTKRSEKDEISFGITPVDIVGDFGREVEREFGLIVSGYNISMICRDISTNLDDSLKNNNGSYEKMTDAALSDGKEHISVSSQVSIANKSYIPADTCDLVLQTSAKPSSSAQHKQQKHHQQNDSIRSKLQTQNSDDHTQSPTQDQNSINDPVTKLITKNSITNQPIANENKISGGSSELSASSSQIGSGSQVINSVCNPEKLIPTAIVKPKYQKSSYDDRQLPIGLGYSNDRNRAWYGNKATQQQQQQQHHQNHHQTHHHQNLSPHSIVQFGGGDQRSRKIQQQFTAHFDRNSKYQKKIIGRCNSLISGNVGGVNHSNSTDTNSLSLTKDKIISTNTRRYIKDNDCTNSFVAIVTPRKKDKMESSNHYNDKRINNMIEKNNNNNNNIKIHKNNSCYTTNNNINNNINCSDTNRHDKFSGKNKKDLQLTTSFDVYNIETALPVIDLEAIENHLKKAKEEERKRRNDREEIRRRLAMGAEDDYFSKMVTADRPGRKPSLQSRLQSGMNLQICFMNDASSDTESPSSDSETCPKLSKSTSNSSNVSSRYNTLSSQTSLQSTASAHPYNSRPLSISINNNPGNKKTLSSHLHHHHALNRPSTLSIGPPPIEDSHESDFFTKQARLQIEARMALAQAKDMAHMQMEIERQKQKQSPITEVIRNSLEKVGVLFPPEKRRVSRQMLTDMNIAQLQIIVNELHTQIECLNEQLVQYLMERDDLHMSQDSMLVDIEDLTRYLGAKEQSKFNEKSNNSNSTTTINNSLQKSNFHKDSTTCLGITNNANITTTTVGHPTTGIQQTQSKFLRIANLVKK